MPQVYQIPARLARPAGRGNLCLFLKNGIEALLGRCEEQSYADGISDRGTPYGFMYATSDSYVSIYSKPIYGQSCGRKNTSDNCKIPE